MLAALIVLLAFTLGRCAGQAIKSAPSPTSTPIATRGDFDDERIERLARAVDSDPVRPTGSPVPVPDVATDQPIPPPEAPATDAPEPGPVYEGGIEEIVCSFDWPCSEAIAVAACESGLDASGRLDGAQAINMWTATADPYDGVFGLFQIALPLHADLLAQYGEWGDPVANSRAAYDLWLGSGGSWYPHWAAECRP